jgi:hypothetical protein
MSAQRKHLKPTLDLFRGKISNLLMNSEQYFINLVAKKIIWESIFKKLKIKLLTSDEEKSFVSKPVLKYLNEKSIDNYLVMEQKENNFGIIERFIRTI